ncbi:MAG: HAMP domain-containing protein [Ardenticatenales bacterium]|nr:HAMP domain-containing protein [Ardenticatenales bacterium]
MMYGSLRARVLAVVFLALLSFFVMVVAVAPTSIGRGPSSVLGLVGGGIVALALAWVSTGSIISQPAERVVSAARRLREGDSTARAALRDRSEIGEMARSFDELAEALRTRERELEALNADLEERVAHRSAALERANGELSASQAELRRLSHELLEVVELERLRLSREVHDQIGQALTGIKMDVAAARRRLAADDVAGANKRLAAAIETVDDTVQLARRIALNLRPSLLDDCGLMPAAEWQMEEFGRRTGIPYQLTAKVDESVIRPQLGTAAYRILEEALTNITRHANASKVDVQLATTTTDFTLTVRDDGRGITDQDRAAQRSLGLVGMRERTLQLGGTLAIVGRSGGDHGTTLTLTLPIEHPTSRGAAP